MSSTNIRSHCNESISLCRSLLDLGGRRRWKLRWEAAGQTNLVIYVDDFQPNSITHVVTFKRKGKCDDDIIGHHRQKVSHPYTLFGCIDISDSSVVVDKKTTQTKFVPSYTAGLAIYLHVAIDG